MTDCAGQYKLDAVQVTIDIPDELAVRLSLERDRLAEIIARGLRDDWSAGSALAEEVIDFLSRGPQPDAIVAFQPSEKSAGRIRELLGKNQRGELTSEEEAEMEHISAVNNLFSLIKAYARQHLQPPRERALRAAASSVAACEGML